MDIRERIKSSPMTGFQIRAIAICFLLNMVDGYDVLVMPLSAPQVADQWGIGDAFLGYLLSASLFGMAIGAFGLAPIADFVGRRKITLFALVLATAGMILGAIAPNAGVLLGSRVLAGIGIGGMVSNLSVIVSEYSNRKKAALATGIYTAGYPLGATLGGAIAGVLIAQWGWREAFYLGVGLTVIMLLICIFMMPESYDYLLSKGDEKSLRKINTILPKLNQPTLTEIPRLPNEERLAVSTLFREVFGKGMWKQTLLAWIGYALLTSSFYFATSWTTKIISDAAGDPNIGVTANVLYNLGGIAGSALFGLVAIKIMPRRLLAITMFLAAGAYLLFGALLDQIYLAMSVGIVAGMLAVAGVAGVYLVGPPIYPTKARGAGFGWLMGIGRLASIFAPIIVGYLLAGGIAPHSVYQLFAIPLTLSGIAFVLLGLVRKSAGLHPEPSFQPAATTTSKPDTASSQPAAVN